jgi:hypothetical protein
MMKRGIQRSLQLPLASKRPPHAAFQFSDRNAFDRQSRADDVICVEFV